MKRISVLLAVLAIMLVGVVPVASATPPQPVEIVTNFSGNTFTSDIPGCRTGTWSDDPDTVHVAGNFAKLPLNIKVEKTLVCDGDGSEFVISFLPKVRRVDPLIEKGPWRIASGMIGGEEVHGTGGMVLDRKADLETFTGKIHIG